MMITRDLNGADISKSLRVLGYEQVRQGGSHIRLTTTVNGVHHLTVPNHSPLKIGTLLGGGTEACCGSSRFKRRGIAGEDRAVENPNQGKQLGSGAYRTAVHVVCGLRSD